MRCPACAEYLKFVEYHGLILDKCPQCGGMWFDKGELRPFIKILANKPKLTKPRHHTTNKTQDSLRTCPRCDKLMDQFMYANDSNIMMDRCSVCKGIWTDAHEARLAALFEKKTHGLGLDTFRGMKKSHVVTLAILGSLAATLMVVLVGRSNGCIGPQNDLQQMDSADHLYGGHSHSYFGNFGGFRSGAAGISSGASGGTSHTGSTSRGGLGGGGGKAGS